MTFIHGYLLAGLILAGLPILVHLIMRRKPRQLPFPAFRFLKRRAHINRRRLRLQHLLLLLLRIGLLVALCLALARPRVESSAIPWNAEQPVAAVFLFDTSASMEYVANGESRLKTAQRMADALLDEMADGSRVAVLDSGDDPNADADWAASLTQARGRIKSLTTRPASHAVNAHLKRTYQILNSLATEEKAPPRLLYIFSDRTRPSWSETVKTEELPAGVRIVYVDVGIEEPHDLAIDRIEIEPPVVEPGQPINVFITVRATGGSHNDQQLVWQIDNDPDQNKSPTRTKFSLKGGEEKRFSFPPLLAPLLPGSTRSAAIQITAKLEKADALVFNNSRSATFLVRNRRSVLTITDNPSAPNRVTFWWEDIFRKIEQGRDRPLHETFRCEVVSTKSVEEWKEDPERPGDPLKGHEIVCLFQVANPKPPSKALWGRLQRYVNGGGNLIIVPGGEELDDGLNKFNAEGQEAGLLPATLVKRVDVPKGRVQLTPATDRHPIAATFVQWNRASQFYFDQPRYCASFARYWEVKPIEEQGLPIFFFADKERERWPFLIEREVGNGKVLMFATPLDRRPLDPKKVEEWNNFWVVNEWFGMALIDQACLYLAGSKAAIGEVNFVCGNPVVVPLLSGSGDKQYQLKGPAGLTLSETKIPPTEGRLLAVPQATHPGNYRVEGEGGGTTVAAFSVNIDAAESNLTRVPAVEIESALGDEALLPPGTAPRLQDAVKDRRGGQIELLPWLMMLVLLALAVESVLANKFYKREANTQEAEETQRIATRARAEANVGGEVARTSV